MEALPNELLLQCFKYLNALDIFYSFGQLNDRFSSLIRNTPLYVDFQTADRRFFDQFCTRLAVEPKLKENVYSLVLSNENACQIYLFLSQFTLAEFCHLRSLTIIDAKKHNMSKLREELPTLTQLSSFRLLQSEDIYQEILSCLPTSQLRILRVPKLFQREQPCCDISSIKSVTVDSCEMHHLSELFRSVANVESLNIQHVLFDAVDRSRSRIGILSVDIQMNLFSLRQFSCVDFYGDFTYFRPILEHTPNLQQLTLCNSSIYFDADANEWQNLITTYLPILQTFRFVFEYSTPDYIEMEFREFQTDFWQKEHHWCTGYSKWQNGASIYTIPHVRVGLYLSESMDEYCYTSTGDTNTFDEITHLWIHPNALTEECQPHFRHIQSISIGPERILTDETGLLKEYLPYLKTIVDCSCSYVENLRIISSCKIESSLVLLEILKQAPNISSLAMNADLLIPLLEDDGLCRYLKKMIKKLDLSSNHPAEGRYCRTFLIQHSAFFERVSAPSDDLYQFNRLWDTFSNIEQLTCAIRGWDSLLFLLQHLSKVSRVCVWQPEIFHSKLKVSSLARKLSQGGMHTIIEDSESADTPSFVWIISNTTV